MKHMRLPALWWHTKFRHLWLAQSISLLGSQVTQLALPLTAIVTLHATDSQLGLIRAAATLPALLFGLLVGAWVDRRRRQPLLVATDVGRAILLASIPLAAVGGWLSIGQLVFVAFGVGALTLCFDVADTALLPVLLPPDHVTAGNSQLEMSRAGAMLLGPSLGVALIHMLSAPFAISADALSFIGSALLLRRIPRDEAPVVTLPRQSFMSEIRAGWHTVWRQPLLRALATSLMLYSFFTTMLNTLYVVYLIKDLQLSPGIVGVIFTVGSLSFLLGATWVGPIARRWGIGRAIVWGAGVSDAAFLLIPLAHGTPGQEVAVLIAAQGIATLAGPVTAISQVSLRQTIIPHQHLGRVSGTMRFFSAGMAPLGALGAGLLGEHLGNQLTIAIAAVGIQCGFLRLLWSPVRHIHHVSIAAKEPIS